MQESFARVETKYLLALPQAAAMEMGLMRLGFEKEDFGCPSVHSLYFDTADYALIRSSLERPAYKEKLRLRAYGEPGRQTLYGRCPGEKRQSARFAVQGSG